MCTKWQLCFHCFTAVNPVIMSRQSHWRHGIGQADDTRTALGKRPRRRHLASDVSHSHQSSYSNTTRLDKPPHEGTSTTLNCFIIRRDRYKQKIWNDSAKKWSVNSVQRLITKTNKLVQWSQMSNFSQDSTNCIIKQWQLRLTVTSLQLHLCPRKYIHRPNIKDHAQAW